MGQVWEEVLNAEPENEEEEIFEEPLTQEQQSLVQLGYLSETFELVNHKITIHTLKIGEELEASLASDRYKDSSEAGRAYVTALVAAAVKSVDNKPLVSGLGTSDETIERRFNYILNNWHWHVIKAIYAKYDALELRASEAVLDLKKD